MSNELNLNEDQAAMADGRRGPALEFAMELLISAGVMHGATRFQSIERAYVNTCFATVEPHTDLLTWLADNHAQVAVPTYTNVGIHDAANPWIRDDEAGRLAASRTLALIDLHKRLGCQMTLTCAPYQLPGHDQQGRHLACSESNAVSYFNSVVGARTLKYGDYMDIAAALTGCVPHMGLHTDEGRRATVVFEVEPLPEALAGDDLAYQLVGHVMGRKTGMDVPALVGLPSTTTLEQLRSVSATGASAGGVAMYHAVGFTPEAPTLDAATQGAEPRRREAITTSDLVAAKRELTQFDSGPINAVAIGTPHSPIAEVGALARLLRDRRIKDDCTFYVQMNRHVRDHAEQQGWIETLLHAGVTPVADTCLYWRPVARGLHGRILTNSGKYAYYAPGELSAEVSIVSLRECVESAIRGEVWCDPALEVIR